MNQIKSLLKENLPVKLLSLLAAIVLWVFVMNEQNPAINSNISVPIYVTNAPEGFKITKDIEDVTLKVRAPRSLMASYNVEDFKAYIDLSEVDEGADSLRIQTVVPSGFELLDMSSEYVDVTLDKLVSRYVDIEINTTGSSSADDKVLAIKPEVTHMLVTGPRSKMDDVVKLIGYANLSGASGEFKTTAELSPMDINGRYVEGVSLSKSNVVVEIKVGKESVTKTVSLHPVATGELPEGLVMEGVKVDPSRIEIAGKEDVLSAIDNINTEPVELDKISESSVIEVGLKIPDGVTSTVSKVQVKIDVRMDKT